MVHHVRGEVIHFLDIFHEQCEKKSKNFVTEMEKRMFCLPQFQEIQQVHGELHMHAGTCVVQWQLCSYRQSSWTNLVHYVCWGYMQDVMEYTLLAFTVNIWHAH